MIGWLIVTIVTILLCVGCWVFAHYLDWDSEILWQFLGSILGITAVVFIGIILFTPPSVKIQIGKFESQKAYIEAHTSKNPLEDATITNTKIEMNAWLFNAQQSERVYGIFSFYPDEIQDMEPIN